MWGGVLMESGGVTPGQGGCSKVCGLGAAVLNSLIHVLNNPINIS